MIIPSIDIMGGKAVQLEQGKKKLLERADVLELAKEFGRYGDIAVIDLDAAMGQGDNFQLVKEICQIAKCRVGGGIRTVEKGNQLLRLGAEKIIIGTNASPSFLKNFPKERIIVAIDSKQGKVVNQGWRNQTGKTPLETIKKLEPYCWGFLYTLVDSEGLLRGIDIEKIKQATNVTKNKVIAAGGITTCAEIKTLEELGVDSQIGMAIYTGKIKLEEAFISLLDFDKVKDLMPTIVQDEQGQLLMLTYSTKESLKEALISGRGVYYSRTRKELWKKGQTSENTQKLLRVEYDCDRDTLFFTVKQQGRACHLGRYSCFGSGNRKFSLEELYQVVRERVNKPCKNSYTWRISRSEKKIKNKIKEECQEILEYSGRDNLIWEISDLTYFLLVLMAKTGVTLNDVKNELRRRRK